MKKLNLGCGSDIRAGYINLDIVGIQGVDVVWDIQKLPLPFNDGQFEEILCNDILEHLVDYLPLMAELRRILANNGLLHIRVPHFTSKNNFNDPTHRRMFSVDTFDFFVRGTKYHTHSSYNALPEFQKTLRTYVSFSHCKWVAPFINRSRYRQMVYENYFWCRLFPGENIEVTLKK